MGHLTQDQQAGIGLKRAPRMIISTEGLDGSGKTDFALRNTPRPLSFHDFNGGYEGTAKGELAAGDITHYRYDISTPTHLIGKADSPESISHYKKVIDRFLAEFRASVEARKRTIVVDTFNEAWSAQRLANKETRWVVYEEEFRSLIRQCMLSDCTNLILISHLKPDWKRDSSGKSYKAGTYSRDGMDGLQEAVQLAIRQSYVKPVMVPGTTMEQTPGGFFIEVLKSRDNHGFTGKTFPAVDFPTLCGMVCPEVDWSK